MTTVSARQVVDLLQPGLHTILLDVAEESTFRASHLPGAVNVPIDGPDFEARVRSLVPDRRTTIVVYAMGEGAGRAARGAEQLRGSGYVDVQEFPDGVRGWREAGYRLESWTGQPAVPRNVNPESAG